MSDLTANGIKGLVDALATIIEEVRTADYTDPLRSIAQEWEDAHAQFFRAETSPRGTPWPPLAQSTIERKGHDTILQETTRLVRSLAGKTEDSIREIESNDDYRGLLFGTDVEYAMFHQLGTERLPQRQHVGITEEMADLAAEIIADHALGVAAYGPLK